jgi:hypothetical protein
MYQIATLMSADGTVSVEAKNLLKDALELMEDEGPRNFGESQKVSDAL